MTEDIMRLALGVFTFLVLFCLALIAAGVLARAIERWDNQRTARKNRERMRRAYAQRRA